MPNVLSDALAHMLGLFAQPEFRANLIYDVGMNVGQDTAYYLAKGFQVIGVEANPTLADLVRRNFADAIANGRLIVINQGIASRRSKRRRFYVNETYHEWSSFTRRIGIRGGKWHEIMIDAVPLRQILQRYGVPYYLKIDIEGADLVALRSLRGLSRLPPYVSVETGAGLEWTDSLYKLGYRGFKLIRQSDIPNVRSDFTFEMGSSGPFGEETSGDWLPYPAFRAHVKSKIRDREPDDPFWYDIHARAN